MFKGLIIGFWMSRVERALRFYWYHNESPKIESAIGTIRAIKGGEYFANHLHMTIAVFLNDRVVCELEHHTHKYGAGHFEFSRFNYGQWTHELYKQYKIDKQEKDIQERSAKEALFEPLDE